MTEQLELLISALFLFTALILVIQKRITSMIRVFTWQSALLVLAILLGAITQHKLDLYLSSILTCILKVIFIPIFLQNLAKKFKSNIQYAPTALVAKPFLLSLLSAMIILFCYHLVIPLRNITMLANGNIISVAIAVILLGMLLIITHRKALSHAIGFMVMENGIFFGALLATSGMPMVVELGVAFDVLVAVILFAVFFLDISSSIDSLDVDRLNKLREDVE